MACSLELQCAGQLHMYRGVHFSAKYLLLIKAKIWSSVQSVGWEGIRTMDRGLSPKSVIKLSRFEREPITCKHV